METDDFAKYKVVLSGDVVDGFDRAVVIERLSALFHSEPHYVERLLTGKQVSLRKEYVKQEATRVCRAVRNAGAQCKLVEVLDKVKLTVDFSDDQPLLKEVEDDEVDDSIRAIKTGRGRSVETSNNTQTRGAAEDVAREYSSDEKLADFIGPNKSYFLKAFGSMGSVEHPQFGWSWNWPAFFAFFIWSLYRKLWVWTGVYLLGGVLLSNVSASLIAMMAYSILWALVANYLYFRHAAKHILQTRSPANAENQQRFLQRSGGVSRIGLWLGIGVSVWMMAYSSQQVVKQLVASYESQYGETIQRRGDGAVLEVDGSHQGELGRTSKALNLLATAFKTVAITGNAETIGQAVQLLAEKSSDGKLLDGWGNPIAITGGDGNVVFISSGPDGITDTNDDVLQTVRY